MKKKIDLEKLRSCQKSFFTLNDLTRIFNTDKDSLKVFLNRQVKKGEIARLRKNAYILPEKISNIRKISFELYQPCYLSFESALNDYGILSQIPYVLTFATTNKSKKIILANQKIEFRQIKKELFSGYRTQNGIFTAESEKALADQIYFISKGLASLNFEELDLSKISLEKLLSIIKVYPKASQRLVRNLEPYFK